LSRTVWFVPIFWTMEATSEKLSDEDKKWLVSDLKPTLVRVRPKYFSVVQNLSFCLSKWAMNAWDHLSFWGRCLLVYLRPNKQILTFPCVHRSLWFVRKDFESSSLM